MVQTLTIRKVMTLSRNIPSGPPWRTVVQFKVVVISVLAGIIAGEYDCTPEELKVMSS